MQADWIIYVTDAGQSDHFKLVFASARRADILPPSKEQPPKVSHVGFGLVLGDDGKRFRTRSSEVPARPPARFIVGPVPSGKGYKLHLFACHGSTYQIVACISTCSTERCQAPQLAQ